MYYYIRNAQGDIIGLVSGNANVVVEYTYDAWGKLVSVDGSLANTLGLANPFRYRGYYYDNETGLYYCQSRYYDPVTGRFINADGLVSTGQGIMGFNMFAYCLNNPVNNEDPTGCKGNPFKKLVKTALSFISAAWNTAPKAVKAPPRVSKDFKNTNPLKKVKVTPQTQKIIDEMAKYDWQVSLSASIDTKSPYSIDASVSKFISPRLGTEQTAISLGASVGFSTLPIPINLSFSVGVLQNFAGRESIEGLAFNRGGTVGFVGYSEWAWTDVHAYSIGISTDPFGSSTGGDYTWVLQELGIR